MLISLLSNDWQVLRAVLRHKGGRGCPGASLRLIPSRKTKDGSFLADLAGRGLLEAAGPPDPPAGPDDPTLDPFRARWRLTDRGRHAAEYGVYEEPGALALPTPEEFAAAKLAEREGRPAARAPKAKR